MDGPTVYAGGYFTNIGGRAQGYLAALGAAGTALPWDPAANSTCVALATDGSTLYVGGGFGRVAGENRWCFAGFTGLPVGVEAESPGAIVASGVTRLWPNPASGPTRIEYAVAREEAVRLSVVDVAGREVAVLARGRLAPGRYSAVWDGSGRSSSLRPGIYFVRWASPDRSQSQRLVRLK